MESRQRRLELVIEVSTRVANDDTKTAAYNSRKSQGRPV